MSNNGQNGICSACGGYHPGGPCRTNLAPFPTDYWKESREKKAKARRDAKKDSEEPGFFSLAAMGVTVAVGVLWAAVSALNHINEYLGSKPSFLPKGEMEIVAPAMRSTPNFDNKECFNFAGRFKKDYPLKPLRCYEPDFKRGGGDISFAYAHPHSEYVGPIYYSLRPTFDEAKEAALQRCKEETGQECTSTENPPRKDLYEYCLSPTIIENWDAEKRSYDLRVKYNRYSGYIFPGEIVYFAHWGLWRGSCFNQKNGQSLGLRAQKYVYEN